VGNRRDDLGCKDGLLGNHALRVLASGTKKKQETPSGREQGGWSEAGMQTTSIATTAFSHIVVDIANPAP